MPLISDNFEHRGSIWSLFQRLAKFGTVKKLCDIRECVKMLLKLPLGNQEQHHEIYWLIIQRIEINAFLRTS